jgi:transposase InsO family protein
MAIESEATYRLTEPGSMRIGLFIPCYIDILFPEVGIATLELLELFSAKILSYRSGQLDQRVRNLRLRVLKIPVRSPQANALCERLLGTLRRECLDYMIPLTERHLRRILTEWVRNYNGGRPHMGLGSRHPAATSTVACATE